ncbi:MAG: hypothetical protein P4L71_02525, partial [Acetobacteraceae bacterium]|nr:hypothetical protein [Acetobacteraceae bacterium]
GVTVTCLPSGSAATAANAIKENRAAVRQTRIPNRLQGETRLAPDAPSTPAQALIQIKHWQSAKQGGLPWPPDRHGDRVPHAAFGDGRPPPGPVRTLLRVSMRAPDAVIRARADGR